MNADRSLVFLLPAAFFALRIAAGVPKWIVARQVAFPEKRFHCGRDGTARRRFVIDLAFFDLAKHSPEALRAIRIVFLCFADCDHHVVHRNVAVPGVLAMLLAFIGSTQL